MTFPDNPIEPNSDDPPKGHIAPNDAGATDDNLTPSQSDVANLRRRSDLAEELELLERKIARAKKELERLDELIGVRSKEADRLYDVMHDRRVVIADLDTEITKKHLELANQEAARLQAGAAKAEPVVYEEPSRADQISILREEAGIRMVPVLGIIACGSPIDIEYQEQDKVAVGNVLDVREKDFLLKAIGDSMTGGGIESGDLVLIRPEEHPENGQVAAVVIEGGSGWHATLKRVFYELDPSKLVLHSMNSDYLPIRIDTATQEIKVFGVFKGLIRQ